ncbi:MAG: pentapeptide repeat-containing protein, partial [Propionibacteriaceae bacterium]|nr:pentapeptide repeat-containing protein [Propionibacteriaceae bacterium]
MTDDLEPGGTADPVGDAQTAESRRAGSLRADCASCAGLCCVALAFGKSDGFAFDKDAGDPCTHLGRDFRCAIHSVLRPRGFPGCTVFDCLGAGQKVTQVTFSGRTWRDEPDSQELMFAAFQVMRPLHELLWYLNDAMSRPQARTLKAELIHAYEETERLTRQCADDVLGIDVTAQRGRVRTILSRASELVRADARRRRKPSKATHRARAGADLIGAALSGLDLRGTDLRGAQLIAANLR